MRRRSGSDLPRGVDRAGPRPHLHDREAKPVQPEVPGHLRQGGSRLAPEVTDAIGSSARTRWSAGLGRRVMRFRKIRMNAAEKLSRARESPIELPILHGGHTHRRRIPQHRSVPARRNPRFGPRPQRRSQQRLRSTTTPPNFRISHPKPRSPSGDLTTNTWGRLAACGSAARSAAFFRRASSPAASDASVNPRLDAGFNWPIDRLPDCGDGS